MPLYASQVSVSGHICSLDQSVGSHGDCFESGGQYINGLMVLTQLQKQRPELPVIMLTGLGSESDVVVGLEMGADDYIAKPFSPREVCARVRTVLRRLQKFAAPPPLLRVGEFTLNDAAARVTWCGQSLNLTRYEFLLLKTLLHSPGRIFSGYTACVSG